MPKFAEIPYYILDNYFEEAHEGVAPEGYTVDTTSGYQDVKFEDTDDWKWVDLNDWSWSRTYLLWPPAWSTGSSLIGDRFGLVGRGGYWTELYVDIDGELTKVKFRSNVTKWVEDQYFIFTKDPSGADFENGSDVYFRKDSFVHEYVSRLAEESGDELYEWYFNPEKIFVYFGKIYLSDSDTREYRIKWYGYKDYALNALPYHNRTEKLKDFFDLYFDRIYSALYGRLKNLITLLDPKEVDSDYIEYIGEMYGITISEELTGSEWQLTEAQQRDFIGNIIQWLKRKGTYTAIYILWKLLVEKNENRLNIYELWDSSATPSAPSLPNFEDRIYTAFYNVEAAKNVLKNGNMELDDYWYDYGSPEFNLRSSDKYFDGSSSRIFRSTGSDDGIESETFETELGKEYKCSAYVWPVDNTNIKIHLTRGTGTGEAFSSTYNSLTLNQWNYIEVSGDQSYGGTSTRVVISCPSGAGVGTYYVDNVRVDEFTGAGDFYYKSKGVSGYPSDYGATRWLSPHYKVEIDLSNQPLSDDAIINQSTILNLIKYWEILRPVSRVAHYRLLLSPTADFKGTWNQLYSGAYPAVCNTVLVPTIAEAAAGTAFFLQEATSDTWYVTHSLNNQNIIIQCFDSSDERLMPDSVEITDSSNVKIELYSPESGLVLMGDADATLNQSSSSTTWTFTHNRNSDVLVMCVNTSRKRIIPQNIQIINSNQLQCTFDVATAGYCFVKDAQYKHTQATAASTWNIYHNLDVSAVMVHCYDSSGNRIYPETLKLVSSNLTMITWGSAVDGYAVIAGVGAPNTQSSVWTPCTSGYIKLGNGDETESWNPWQHNDIKNTVITIPNSDINYYETSDYYYITTENVLAKYEENFTEIGVFNVSDELVWYTYCDPLFKPYEAGLTLHYRIKR